MSYANGSGNVGVCECGRMASESCRRCGRILCDTHARALPSAPGGLSPNAVGRFELAIRSAEPHCEACRTEFGNHALAQAVDAPRAELPDHWLDRALALSGDQTRSEAEKLEDARLPPSLTPAEVAKEFLRRVERMPCESVPISPPSVLRTPDFVEGWSVDCRRTTYNATGVGQRFTLPCLISVNGELLGPALEAGDRQGQTWWIVPDADIELERLVTGVATLLVLSAFMPPSAQSRIPFG